MRWGVVVVAAVASARSAGAEPEPRPQVQADLGLAVVGAVYERPLGTHVALGFEAQAFSTYFLPWFSAGSSLAGFGGELRASWFAGGTPHGLYIAPYARIDSVTNDHDRGVGYCAGAFVGWAFALTATLDARIGAGAQYMHYDVAPSKVDTPFAALDLLVGYRL
jgi:hypothetical protein